MEIILLQRVEKLGHIGDIVNVVLLDASKKRRQISFQIEQATK